MRYSSKGAYAVGLLLVASAAGWAEEPDVLVLRGGGTLVGKVTKEGDWYALRTLSGSGESRFPAAAVAKVCQGPRQAYEFLKTGITADEPLDHCRLASFCLTHELYHEAEAEIEAALLLDTRCQEARTLRSQLQLKKSRPKKTEPAVPALPSTMVTPMPPARLEEWPLALTPSGFSDFQQRIQPMLLTGCGTGACHGVSEGKRAFFLTRGLYGAAPSPLVTRGNLERVLGAVSRENPDESPLLIHAHQVHGGSKAAPMDPQTYALLRQWVWNMANKQDSAAKLVTKEEPFAPAASVPAPTRPAEGFAAGETSTGAAGASNLPPIPGLSGGAARQLNLAEPPSLTQTAASQAATPPTAAPPAPAPRGLPPIPGLTGKAAEQMGQKPPTVPPMVPAPASASPSVPPSEAPKKIDPKDLPAFQDYAKSMGIVPPAANVTREPPRQMKLANAASYQTAFPPPPVIPDDVFFQMQQQAKAKATDPASMHSGNAPFLHGGTPVSAPKK